MVPKPNLYFVSGYGIHIMDANIPAEGQTGQGFNENISLIKTSSVSFIHKSNSRKLLIGKMIDFPDK